MAHRIAARPLLRTSAPHNITKHSITSFTSISSRALHHIPVSSVAVTTPRVLSLSRRFPETSNYPTYHNNRLAIRTYASVKKENLPTGKDVSTSSTIHSITREVGQKGSAPILAPTPDIDMTKAMRNDFKAIRETFALSSVPREAYVLGLAGTIPYFGTSLTTLFCAWDLNYAAHHNGAGYIISPETACQLLNFLGPIQVAWGAVILSFLSAIHWGLEFAGYGGYHSYRRYAIGVVVPAFAWSTIMLPQEWALAAQFLGFTMLYFIDSTVTTRGWTPPWYSSYRFVLTLIAGASIVLSLVGRGEVGDKEQKRKLPNAVDRIRSEDKAGDHRARYEGERAKVLDKKQEQERKKREEEEKQKEEEERQKAEEEEQAGKDGEGKDKKDEGEDGK